MRMPLVCLRSRGTRRHVWSPQIKLINCVLLITSETTLKIANFGEQLVEEESLLLFTSLNRFKQQLYF